MTRRNYTNLDLAKFVCGLLVVIIHTEPLADCAPEINFFFVNILARVAVPLFFVMSGFFLFGPMQYENSRLSACAENINRVIRYWKKIALLYGGWSLIYLLFIKIPMWYATGWWGLHVIKDAVVSILFVGTHYHLWYLLALLYAVPLLFLLQRILHRKTLIFVAVLLWVFECLRYSYAWLGADRIASLQWIAQRMPIVFDSVFRAVPLMLFGANMAQTKAGGKRKRLGMLALLGFGLCMVEVYALRSLTPNNQRLSYLIFTPFMAISILRFLCDAEQVPIDRKWASLLRDMSTNIYCLHPMLIELLIKHEFTGYKLWAMTTLLSVAIAWLAISGRKYLKRN